ncbi:MAG: YaiO family outer membrane beta-barrel protein [Gemmatimonadaceae bacterium]
MIRTAAVVLALFACARIAPAQEASESRKDTPRITTLGVDDTYQNFMGDIEPWHVASVSLGQRTSAGSLVARANVARRFATTGTQVEVDAYPRLGNGRYAYLNAGYSSASIFPDWRFGGELYTNLPDAWEASLGFRHLRFDTTHVTLYTGTVGKYSGNYWLSLRPFIRSKAGSTSASASITGRRYYQDGDNYIGARVGFGSTPSDQLTPDVAVSRTNSFSAAINGSRSLSSTLLGTWSLGGDSEEITTTETRRSITGSAGLKIRL